MKKYDVGGAIWRVRNAAGMTQEKLVQKASVSRVSICNYERNHSEPSLQIVQSIMEALAVVSLNESFGCTASWIKSNSAGNEEQALLKTLDEKELDSLENVLISLLQR